MDSNQSVTHSRNLHSRYNIILQDKKRNKNTRTKKQQTDDDETTATKPVTHHSTIGPTYYQTRKRTMQPVHRRRRKRPRDDNKKQNTAAPAASSSRRAMPNLEDDADLAFLDNSGDKPQKPFVQTCLPILLAERQGGSWNRRQCSWQSRVLSCIDDDDDSSKRRRWRPFASRSIPFTLLGTPASAAVLALERNASYVLSLGGKQGNDDSSDTTLALRFYGKSNDNVRTRTVRDGNPSFA
jgi:hypothetical protein